MRFSERKGFVEIPKIIQKDNVSSDLRIALWNIFYQDTYGQFPPMLPRGFRELYWCSFLKKSIDSIPNNLADELKNLFENGEWYELYDFLEIYLSFRNYPDLNERINHTLEVELSGYRYVGNHIADITDDQEIEMLSTALSDEKFPHVREHLNRALELLSDRKPDYRNSIKESISAVESIAKEISGKPKAELGEALKEIEKQGKLHGALTKSFLNLYGYTSDASGIRHALMEEDNLTADDAKFFLLSCTSFINYLKSKM